MAQKRKHFNNTDLKYKTSDSKPQFTQCCRAWLPVSELWKKMVYLHAEHEKSIKVWNQIMQNEKASCRTIPTVNYNLKREEKRRNNLVGIIKVHILHSPYSQEEFSLH